MKPIKEIRHLLMEEYLESLWMRDRFLRGKSNYPDPIKQAWEDKWEGSAEA